MSKAEELAKSIFGNSPGDEPDLSDVIAILEAYGRLVQEAAAEELDDAILGGAARIIREMRLP